MDTGSPFVRWLWERVRERPQMSREQIADAIGVPGSVLSEWINRKSLPGRKNMRKLADYFEVPEFDIYQLVNQSTADTSRSASAALTNIRRGLTGWEFLESLPTSQLRRLEAESKRIREEKEARGEADG